MAQEGVPAAVLGDLTEGDREECPEGPVADPRHGRLWTRGSGNTFSSETWDGKAAELKRALRTSDSLIFGKYFPKMFIETQNALMLTCTVTIVFALKFS